MTMTDDERTIYNFKSMINLIQVGADGYALPDQGTELHILSIYVLKIDTMLLGRNDLNAEQRSLLVLADTTSKWIAEMISGRRDPAIAQAQFRARAELIDD